MSVDHHVKKVPLQHLQPPHAQPKQQPKNKTTHVVNSNGKEARKSTTEVKIGDFAAIALKFPGRNQKTNFIYMAEVFSVDAAGEGLIMVKIMLKCGCNLYAWSNVDKQEYSSQSSSDIFKVKLQPWQMKGPNSHLIPRSLMSSKVELLRFSTSFCQKTFWHQSKLIA